jgi:hypothetical protein
MFLFHIYFGFVRFNKKSKKINILQIWKIVKNLPTYLSSYKNQQVAKKKLSTPLSSIYLNMKIYYDNDKLQP